MQADIEFLASELFAKTSGITDQELLFTEWALAWREQARYNQLPPDGDWNSWGIQAGRGFGKTKTGAHWIVEQAAMQDRSFNGLIAPTFDDVQFTMIEGVTGILNETPQRLIDDYNISNHLVTLWNGSRIRGFSSEKPRKLRGPQHHNVWGDEVASWERAIDTYDMMKFGLRLGKHPRFLWTTTPKANKIMKRLKNADNTVIDLGTSFENAANLSDVFWQELMEYEGTKLGRQELYAEDLDAEEDGYIKNAWIKLWPARKALPRFKFLIASLDTAFTEKAKDKKTHDPDWSVMHVWGLFVIGNEYHVMLLDAWRDHLGFPQLVQRVQKEILVTYGTENEPLFKPLIIVPGQAPIGHQGKGIDLIIIEDKGSGISLRQQLAFENVLAHPYNPARADKLLRLHLVSPMFLHGRVWMPESMKHPGKVRAWAEPVREALCTFRGEGSIDHDDDVDAATQALRYIKDNFMKSLTSQTGSHVVHSDRSRGSAATREHQNPYAQ